MTVEQGTQGQILESPRSPVLQLELPKDKLFVIANACQQELSRVLIDNKDFQEVYRSQTEQGLVDWKIKYASSDHIYNVESEILTDGGKFVRRRLDVMRSYSLSYPTLDLEGNILKNDGPFMEERVILVMSGSEPVLYYSKKRSDRERFEEEYKNNNLAEERIKMFTHISKIFNEVKTLEPAKPKKKPGKIVFDGKSKQEEHQQTFSMPVQDYKTQERSAILHNSAYRNRVIRKKIDNFKWGFKLRLKYAA